MDLRSPRLISICWRGVSPPSTEFRPHPIRRIALSRHRRRLASSLLLAWLGVSSGCGGESNPGVIPESKDANATRKFIENPAGIKERPSSKAKKVALPPGQELPPQPPK
jgi:hypothetical protein